MKLKDKVIIVTGASRGIGRTLCLAFAKEGATIVAAAAGDLPYRLIYRIGACRLSGGGHALAIQCDVSIPEDVQALVDTTIQRFGRIDILVNNAGVGIWKDILSLTVEDWDRTMDVNLKGVFLACKYALPSMMERRQGHIINVSSSMARRYTPNDLAYSPSKAALDRFSMNLAHDVERYNIAVNSFGPGYVKTDMARRGFPEPVEMVIPAALWLSQQDASSFTGQVIYRRDFGKTWGNL